MSQVSGAALAYVEVKVLGFLWERIQKRESLRTIVHRESTDTHLHRQKV